MSEGISKVGESFGKIMTVRDLITQENIVIPEYQRPYKWTTKNVLQLLTDIQNFKKHPPYRLGTIVFHEDGNKNIVDGQQRFITLLLIANAMLNENKLDEKEKIAIEKNLSNIKFTNDISKYNIKENYHEILRFIKGLSSDEKIIDFILNQCEVVTFSLSDISEAFQFFDSQNSRGKDLEPHDLLKAYHLREFTDDQLNIRTEIIKQWEDITTQDLANLFSQYLYRIRNWSRGESARYFGKKDVDLFKGIKFPECSYPYAQNLKIVDGFINNWNNRYERAIDNNRMEFPFSLDGTIINGVRFFQMVAYYQKKLESYNKDSKTNENDKDTDKPELVRNAESIFTTINSYSEKNRIGDRYIRSVFDCLLFYYIEKFGYKYLSQAIEKIFIWAYSLRLRQKRIELASVDNYVFERENPFKVLKYADHPLDFINLHIPNINEINSTNTKDINDLFIEKGYYTEEGESQNE